VTNCGFAGASSDGRAAGGAVHDATRRTFLRDLEVRHGNKERRAAHQGRLQAGPRIDERRRHMAASAAMEFYRSRLASTHCSHRVANRRFSVMILRLQRSRYTTDGEPGIRVLFADRRAGIALGTR